MDHSNIHHDSRLFDEHLRQAYIYLHDTGAWASAMLLIEQNSTASSSSTGSDSIRNDKNNNYSNQNTNNTGVDLNNHSHRTSHSEKSSDNDNHNDNVTTSAEESAVRKRRRIATGINHHHNKAAANIMTEIAGGAVPGAAPTNNINVAEVSWNQQIIHACEQVAAEQGTPNFTLDDLVDKVYSKTIVSLPKDVKVKLVREIANGLRALYQHMDQAHGQVEPPAGAVITGPVPEHKQSK